MSINETKLQEFLGGMVKDLGAAANSVLVMMGDKLGLYKAIAEAGPLTSLQLAERTGTAPKVISPIRLRRNHPIPQKKSGGN